MSEFADKRVIVTGAAGALGQSVAAHFRDNGARVAHIDYSDTLLDKAFPDRSNTSPHLYHAVDLTQRDATAACINNIAEQFAGIDIIANIAGGFTMGEAVHETSDATWDFLFNLNTRSVLHTSAAAVPIMINAGGGKIINISAGAAHKGAALMGAYVASKSAVWRLTESMADELRDKNINVNCILPGIIDTQRNREDMPDADHDKWVPPEQLASVIGFLASDAGIAVHGAGIPVVGLS